MPKFDLDASVRAAYSNTNTTPGDQAEPRHADDWFSNEPQVQHHQRRAILEARAGREHLSVDAADWTDATDLDPQGEFMRGMARSATFQRTGERDTELDRRRAELRAQMAEETDPVAWRLHTDRAGRQRRTEEARAVEQGRAWRDENAEFLRQARAQMG